jgi:hypothetical protein
VLCGLGVDIGVSLMLSSTFLCGALSAIRRVNLS